ncbi:caspase-8-like, partial [Lingula anatina]|uniref:Caspase-8-like n=1 Tax=Lingula anatina TaxID=7574 RepID=A0A1S3IS56_LINAN
MVKSVNHKCEPYEPIAPFLETRVKEDYEEQLYGCKPCNDALSAVQLDDWNPDPRVKVLSCLPTDTTSTDDFGKTCTSAENSKVSESGIKPNHNEVDNTRLKTWYSGLSLARAYSEPNIVKGTRWGFTLIFNMINFSKEGLERRDGAEYDERLIMECLTELGSEVKIYRDMPKKNLLKTLEEYSKKDHSTTCNFACFILSHGSEEGIYCSDGKFLFLTDAINPFRQILCPSLKKKPKIFFIEAFLGHKDQ